MGRWRILLLINAYALHVANSLCGMKGSPAFRVAENIVDNSTARDWSVLRCFLALQARINDSGSNERFTFSKCIVAEIGAAHIGRNMAAEIDSLLLQYKVKREGLYGLPELQPCLKRPMSCSEASNLLTCRHALDEVYNARSVEPTKRSEMV